MIPQKQQWRPEDRKLYRQEITTPYTHKNCRPVEASFKNKGDGENIFEDREAAIGILKAEKVIQMEGSRGKKTSGAKRLAQSWQRGGQQWRRWKEMESSVSSCCRAVGGSR